MGTLTALKTKAATCLLCGRPKKCYKVEIRELLTEGDMCLSCLKACARVYADVMAEEDAKGFEEGIKEASKIFKGEDAR